MKKMLGVLAVIVVLVIVAVFLIGGMGFGTGNGDGDGTAASNSTEQADQITDEVVEEDPEPVQTESGDNKGSEEGTILEVSVVKSEYFYQNKSIELSSFIEIVKEVDGKLVVEITDDNAALKAYNKLIDELETLAVPYIETAGN